MAGVRKNREGEYCLITRSKKTVGKISINEKVKETFIIKCQETVSYKNKKKYYSHCGLLEIAGITIVTPTELIGKRVKIKLEVQDGK